MTTLHTPNKVNGRHSVPMSAGLRVLALLIHKIFNYKENLILCTSIVHEQRMRLEATQPHPRLKILGALLQGYGRCPHLGPRAQPAGALRAWY